MATSGSTDYSLTCRQIVDEAFSVIAAYSAGETFSDEDGDTALRALNLMLKTWGTQGMLWLESETSLVLTATTQSYALPAGVRTVIGVRRRTSNIDTPLTEIGREEYFDLPTKTATGTPVSWYQSRQRTAVTLYIWPTASTSVASDTTLRYTYQRIIEDCDSLDNDPDVPQEWLETLAWNLADRIKGRFGGLSLEDKAEIERKAAGLLRLLMADEDEPASVFFGVGR